MQEKRQYSAEEKLRILEEAHQPGVSVAEVCRRHGLASSVFYRWEDQCRAAMKEAFDDRRGRKSGSAEGEVARLKAELEQRNRVIAELTSALIEEKKGLCTYLKNSGDLLRKRNG